MNRLIVVEPSSQQRQAEGNLLAAAGPLDAAGFENITEIAALPAHEQALTDEKEPKLPIQVSG